jgi:hypothetical protein
MKFEQGILMHHTFWPCYTEQSTGHVPIMQNF